MNLLMYHGSHRSCVLQSVVVLEELVLSLSLPTVVPGGVVGSKHREFISSGNHCKICVPSIEVQLMKTENKETHPLLTKHL